MEPSVAAPPSPPSPFPVKWKKMESPNFSPGSDNQFWSSLRTRIDTLLERKSQLEHQFIDEKSGEVEVVNADKLLSDDTALLLRGFDSVAHSLSQLSSNIDSALQGAKELAKPPTMADILQASLRNTYDASKDKEEANDNGKKRKLETEHPSKCPKHDSSNVEEKSSPDDKMLKKAKNLAVSMATKASFLAKELKSIKSDLCFTQERIVILEEENERLRNGYNKSIQLEEEDDDLVRLQLEALLSEKSRLANENANLKRENQCLRQLVEYHQATSQDLAATYEEVMNGICLDFSSPPPSSSKVDGRGGDGDDVERKVDNDQPGNEGGEDFEFSSFIGKGCDANEHHFEGFVRYSP